MTKGHEARMARLRRAKERERAIQVRVTNAQVFGQGEGFRDGVMSGRQETLRRVLWNAGALYEQGKDSDAAAVREVYRKIAGTADVNGEAAAAQKKAA